MTMKFLLVRTRCELVSVKDMSPRLHPSVLYKMQKCMFLTHRCKSALDIQTARHRVIDLYLTNGNVTKTVVVSHVCNSSQCLLEIYPNFISNMGMNEQSYSFSTHQQFVHGNYIYLGGRVAFERSIFKLYSGLLP